MKRYLIIESKLNILEHVDLIESLFSAVVFLHRFEVKNDHSIFMVFESEKATDFEGLILNLKTDIFTDIRLYVSPQLHEHDIVEHFDFVQSLLKQISIAKYAYLDEKIILKDQLLQVTKEHKQHILSKYYQDQVMLDTVKAYLESNQNMSLAAKKIYIHRNTLIQRIDKFYQVTDFDVRNFNDAFLIYHILIK